MTNTLTIRLLDREVVLTRDANGNWRGEFDGAEIGTWTSYHWEHCVITPPGYAIEAASKTIEQAFADLDAKLRQLREWLR